MSLEHELVFELRDKGNSPKDVLEIVKYMADPKTSPYKPVKLNRQKINASLKKYDLIQEYNNSEKKQSIIKNQKRILEEMILKEKEKLMENENIISVKIIKEKSNVLNYCQIKKFCSDCVEILSHFYAKISYLDKTKNGLVMKKNKEKNLFLYCKKCGDIQPIKKDPKDY